MGQRHFATRKINLFFLSSATSEVFCRKCEQSPAKIQTELSTFLQGEQRPVFPYLTVSREILTQLEPDGGFSLDLLSSSQAGFVGGR
jgi:hypothetical protein